MTAPTLPAAQAARVARVVRWTLAFVFVYHGVAPKLLTRDPDELAMLAGLGVPADRAPTLLAAIGVAEVAWGLAFLALPRSGSLLLATSFTMVTVLAGVAATSPRYLTSAFNPVTLNLSVAALALVGWLLLEPREAMDTPADPSIRP